LLPENTLALELELEEVLRREVPALEPLLEVLFFARATSAWAVVTSATTTMVMRRFMVFSLCCFAARWLLSSPA
jgi:hypothetical protein